MLIVFDLDFTLWDCGGTWCDHTNPPYFRKNGIIHDEDGRKLQLYPQVYSILERVREKHIPMSVASRTSASEWADDLMHLFDIKKFFDHFEIYPGSKLSHFKSLQQKTNMSYGDMVFFDDEYRNIHEVAQLGVESIFVDDGMTNKLIDQYLI
jgi:magnesium-dependent phosphatase 1